jgi:hypothetical protein
MEYIIKPAVEEFGLIVVRADQMGKAGMIGKQVIEHILNARLVIADLSFHNPMCSMSCACGMPRDFPQFKSSGQWIRFHST